MKRGHIARRSCHVCSLKAAKSVLIRHVAIDNRLVLDTGQQLPGRGIYCCNTKQCSEQLLNDKKIIKKIKMMLDRRGRE